MTAVNAAIQAAKAAAAQMVSAPAEITAYTSPTGVAVPMMKPSMSMANASTSLIPRTAQYVKVNEFGILIGKGDKKFKSELKVKLNLTEDRGFSLKWTLRYGNPAQYMSTYDGVVCDKGGNWADVQAKVMAIDPKAQPYLTVDILVETLEKIDTTGGGIEPGTKLALSLSKTNFSEWQDFYNEAKDAGRLGQEVTAKIGFRDVHHNGNDWGVLTFSFDE
jgi:hypothetical protein